MKRVAVLAAAFAAMALAAAACGGSSARPAGTATTGTATIGTAAATQPPGGGTPVPAETGVVISGSPVPTWTPTPFTDAQKTALAQGPNVPFFQHKSSDGRYTVSLPVGWDLQDTSGGLSVILAGAPASAVIGIVCAPNATVDQLIALDQSIQQQIGEGTFTLDKEFATTVAGFPAREVPWQGQFDGIVHLHWYVYFEARGCAWRFALSTFPNVNVTDMQAIFRRMLDSFKLT
ncbi:MAG: hypothetical protein ACYDEB_11870 [Dehalococcoidia bacterium]